MRQNEVVIPELLVDFLNREIRQMTVLVGKISQVEVVAADLEVCRGENVDIKRLP